MSDARPQAWEGGPARCDAAFVGTSGESYLAFQPFCPPVAVTRSGGRSSPDKGRGTAMGCGSGNRGEKQPGQLRGLSGNCREGHPGVQSRGSSRKVQMLVWSLSPSPSVGSDHATILITCLCPERTARHRVCSLPLLRYEKEWWLGAWRRRRRVRDLADARSTALRPAPVGARCGAGQPAEPSHPPVREGGGSQRPVARHGTARRSRSFPPGSPRRGRRPNG